MNEKILWAKDHKELYDLLEQTEPKAMTKKVYWAEDENDFMQFLQKSIKKHYDNQMEVWRWLNAQSLQVEVWKN